VLSRNNIFAKHVVVAGGGWWWLVVVPPLLEQMLKRGRMSKTPHATYPGPLICGHVSAVMWVGARQVYYELSSESPYLQALDYSHLLTDCTFPFFLSVFLSLFSLVGVLCQ